MRILHLSNFAAVVESTRAGEKITIKDPDKLLFPHAEGGQLPIEQFEPVKILGVPPWIKRSDYFFPAEVNVDEQGSCEVVYAPYHDLFKYLYMDNTKWSAIELIADNISPPLNTGKVLNVLTEQGMSILFDDLASKTGTGLHSDNGTGTGALVLPICGLPPKAEPLDTFNVEFDPTQPAYQLVEKIKSIRPELSLYSMELFKGDIAIYFYFRVSSKRRTMPYVPMHNLSIKHNVDNYAVAVKALGATDVNGEHLQLSEASVIDGRLPQITKITTHDNIWSLSELKLAQDDDLRRYKGYDISFSVNVHDLLPLHLKYQSPTVTEPSNPHNILPFSRWRVPSLQPADEQEDYGFIVDKVVFDNTNPAECNVYFVSANSLDDAQGLSRVLAGVDPARSTAQVGTAPKGGKG